MILRTLWVIGAVALIGACSEKPQTAGGAKQDAAAYTGTGMAYTEKNWKTGDKTSRESALRARTQSGQNDYSRMN